MVIQVAIATETAVVRHVVIMKGVLGLQVVMHVTSEPGGSVVVIFGPRPPTIHGGQSETSL